MDNKLDLHLNINDIANIYYYNTDKTLHDFLLKKYDSDFFNDFLYLKNKGFNDIIYFDNNVSDLFNNINTYTPYNLLYSKPYYKNNKLSCNISYLISYLSSFDVDELNENFSIKIKNNRINTKYLDNCITIKETVVQDNSNKIFSFTINDIDKYANLINTIKIFQLHNGLEVSVRFNNVNNVNNDIEYTIDICGVEDESKLDKLISMYSLDKMEQFFPDDIYTFSKLRNILITNNINKSLSNKKNTKCDIDILKIQSIDDLYTLKQCDIYKDNILIQLLLDELLICCSEYKMSYIRDKGIMLDINKILKCVLMHKYYAIKHCIKHSRKLLQSYLYEFVEKNKDNVYNNILDFFKKHTDFLDNLPKYSYEMNFFIDDIRDLHLLNTINDETRTYIELSNMNSIIDEFLNNKNINKDLINNIYKEYKDSGKLLVHYKDLVCSYSDLLSVLKNGYDYDYYYDYSKTGIIIENYFSIHTDKSFYKLEKFNDFVLLLYTNKLDNNIHFVILSDSIETQKDIMDFIINNTKHE